ncbi:MAG: hypothetical protein QW502_04965 [Candidatus Bathyarchaeia archaeon]|nr:hypothetical protein [Candidatus Bathyarchaeota archaeon]
MIKRAMLMRLSLLIVELTSLPLIVLASIYMLSGYQLLNPEVRIIPEPRRIHTDRFLRILTIFLAYLHAFGGAIIVAERRLRKETLRKIIEAAMITAITVLLIALLIIELAL